MARMTPGKRLVRLLNKSLAEGCSWTESELVSLAKIGKAEDRLAVLEAIFATETAKAEPSTRRVAEVSGEIRQTEQLIVRRVGSLMPDPDAVLVPKARQQQAAARARWDSRSHRRVSA